MFTRARNRAVVALLVIVAGWAIAACGSSSSNSSASASASAAGASTTTTSTGTPTTGGRGGFTSLTAAQRSCLKAKGVTLPTGRGHGFANHTGTGTFTRPTGTPPGGTSTTGGPGGGAGGGGFFGGAGGGTRGANASKYAAAFKACGVSFGGGLRGGFGRVGAGAGAKVSTSAIRAFVACVKKNGYDLTSVNTSGKGAVLPASLQKNQKFLAAAKNCTSLLRPTSAPGGTSTTPSG